VNVIAETGLASLLRRDAARAGSHAALREAAIA